MSQYDDNFRPIDLKDVRTYPLSSRSSKVNLNDFAKPLEEGLSSDEFLRRLPNILAVQTLRQLVAVFTELAICRSQSFGASAVT
jgi:hypothetical protein